VGVYASRRLFPLQRGPWCYLVTNLRDATWSVVAALPSVCRRA
jgi:hypothetical protein